MDAFTGKKGNRGRYTPKDQKTLEIYMAKALSLEDSFKFGKHNGQQVEDVVEDDPSYVRWLAEEKDFNFGEDVLQALEKRESRK